MEKFKQIKITKLTGGVREEKSDLVVSEKAINIFVNFEFYAALMCSPAELVELATGFLFSEGVISSLEDIKSIEEKYEDRVCVVLKSDYIKDLNSIKAKASGCGNGSVHINLLLDRNFKCIEDNEEFLAENILNTMQEFNNKSELFKKTGGVHSCAICNNSGIVVFSEDIGRHNALDKVIGAALRNGIDFENKFIMTSGRISSDIVLKAANAEIPMIVSHSAPTDLALNIAEVSNITIIGFARGNKMNIYCNEKRIINSCK